ncbi:MAG: ureidoglycolate lyase [Granulosicoccus sp.]
MKSLTPEPLTAEQFRAYGSVIETANAESISINNGNCLRYSNLANLDVDDSGVTGISLFEAKPISNPYQLSYVERHPLGSQAFIPMTQEKFLVIVADELNGVAKEPRVFITDGRQGVNYRRNVWHGVLAPMVASALFAVVDYIGARENLEEYEYQLPYDIEF